MLLHIRAERADLCFELATRILDRLGAAFRPEFEVQGFRYFDNRDLLGFVDGTENPTGPALRAAALIASGEHAGGKLDNVEVDEAELPTSAHRLLTTITSADGTELKIVRDNMPFGSPAAGEFGTLFLGYAADPAVTETMLRRMFLGDPPGNYDRILDFSTAVTGGLFFVPSATALDDLAEAAPAVPGT